MEDIKVNDYIRTNLGRIGKIKEITNDYIFTDTEANCIAFKDCNHFFKETFNQVVKKHSKNIIDLIEVGDLIHIILPADKYCDEDVEAIWHISDEKMLHNIKIQIMTNELKLLDIVTKELFNSIKYEVED